MTDTATHLEPPAEPPAAPPEPPGRTGGRGWTLAAVGVLILAGLTLLAANLTLPYYEFSPGRPIEIENLVTATGLQTYEHPGGLYLLTVGRSEVNVFGYVEARWFDPTSRIIPRDAVTPPGVNDEEQRRQDLAAMEESKDTAVVVALQKLGYQFTEDGAEVMGLSDGGPSEGILQPGDIITAVDGQAVTTTPGLVDALSTRSPGDVVALTFLRDGTTMEEKVTLGSVQLDDGTVRPVIGVTAITHFLFPVDVEIDTQNVAGPSGGLMLTIGVMNLLSEEDLTRGHQIAGTGTIALDGTIGPIGGMAQKVYGAEAAGAEVVFAPRANYEEALQAAGNEITIVPVDTVDDALAYLATLPPA